MLRICLSSGSETTPPVVKTFVFYQLATVTISGVHLQLVDTRTIASVPKPGTVPSQNSMDLVATISSTCRYLTQNGLKLAAQDPMVLSLAVASSSHRIPQHTNAWRLLRIAAHKLIESLQAVLCRLQMHAAALIPFRHSLACASATIRWTKPVDTLAAWSRRGSSVFSVSVRPSE